MSGSSDVYVAGNHAFVTYNRFYSPTESFRGLKVIDINDPNTPHLIGSWDTPGDAQDVYVADNFAYVADDYFGVQIIDINNPNTPYLVGSYGISGSAYGIYVTDNHVYIADGSSGLQVAEKFKPINDIKYRDSYIIKFTIPAGYSPGPYNLLITNPYGEHTIFHNVFTVYQLP